MFFLIACSEEIITNPELLFDNSLPLIVSSYEYSDIYNKTYFMGGDTSCLLNITDTINSIPVLAWDSIYLPIVTVAIFNSSIQVSGSTIRNINNIVWQWHTGITSSTYLNGMQYVDYKEGKKLNNNEIDYTSSVDSLPEGLYYWAVWGWSASGVDIIYSSRELNFYVKN